MPTFRITIHIKVIALSLVFFLLLVASFLATFLIVQVHFWEEETSELVSKNIPIIQNLTRLAISGSSQDEINTAILESEQILEEVHAAVKNLNKGIPLATSRRSVQIQLEELASAWETYKLTLSSFNTLSLDDPLRPQAEENLRADTLIIVSQIEELTVELELFSDSRHVLLLNMQVGFVITTGFVTILVYLLVRNRVIKPLFILSTASKNIGKGILNKPLELTGEDEIGQLAHSYEQMRTALLAFQSDLETRIKERTAEIVTASDFSQEIVSQRDVNTLIESAIAKSRTLMDAKDASLCLLTEGGCSVELASTTNLNLKGKKISQPIGDNLPNLVVTENQTISAQVSSFGCAFLRHAPEDQCLAAPLKVGERVLGAMCVTRSNEKTFKEEESRAFSLLANSAAVAISNAYYEEETRKQMEQAAIVSERERLAAELHDNLAQTLSFTSLKISQIQDKIIPLNDEAAQVEVETIRINVENAINQIRTITGELAFTQLGEDTMNSQLEMQVKKFKETSGILVDMIGTGDYLDRLPALVQKQLLMMLSEALTNIQRHAGAEHVAIRFSTDPDGMFVTVEDNGRGFQPTMFQGKHHLGLRIMRTRAERIGGTINIDSAVGKGTRVMICLPMAAQGSG